jgi:hypothetical protein
MKIFKSLVCIFAFFLLFACGDSNPLLGKWASQIEVEIENSDTFQIPGDLTPITIFTRSERILELGPNQFREKVKYRKNSDDTWAITHDGGKSWTTYKVLDQDNIVLNTDMGKMIPMKRVK